EERPNQLGLAEIPTGTGMYRQVEDRRQRMPRVKYMQIVGGINQGAAVQQQHNLHPLSLQTLVPAHNCLPSNKPEYIYKLTPHGGIDMLQPNANTQPRPQA